MKRALVADDDPAIRSLIASLLKSEGVAEVVEATDGAEAMDQLSRGEFDLILLEWYMPNVSGLDVIEDLRRRGSRAPVVMVTAEARKEQVVMALRAGATDYLIKPFDHDVFRQRLEKYFRDAADWEEPAVHRARDVMNREVVTIGPDGSVGEAIERLLQHSVSGLPVVDHRGNLVGIVTEFQLVKAIYRPEIREQEVRDLMTRDVLVVKEETDLAVVAKMMEKYRVRRIPVTRNGKVVGIIARRDLLRYITKHDDAQGELLDNAELSVSA